MKKRFLLFVALFSLMLTGCFEKQPMDVLKETTDVSKNAKSVEVTASIVAKVEGEGMNLDLNLPVNVAVNASNEKNIFIKLGVGENMFVDKFEAYLNLKEENLTAYLPISLLDTFYLPEQEVERNKEWVTYSEKIELDEETIDEETLTKLENLDIAKVVTEENFVYVDEKDNIKHYQLILNDALLTRLAAELGETIEEEDKLGAELKMDVYINADTYEMTKIVIDMKDMLADMEELENEMISLETIKELKFELEFKNYNKTVVTIPNDTSKSMTMDEYLNTVIGEE